jgi:glycosyltransferase involved in cell wall biosynthesis
MTTEPLVSIVLPVYNGESHVGGTLDSALGQTYRHIEVLVVDDGSRDRTLDIVQARATDDSRVRVITQTNHGVAAARNTAVAAARGEFVAPLDADDVWDPTKIERQVRRMIEVGETTGLVYCWWISIDVDGAILDSSPRWRIEGHASEMLLQVNYTGNASVPLFRRRYLEQAGGYDVTLHERDGQGAEDWDLALKVAERSRVAVVPSLLVGYRRRQDSMSSRSDRMWRSHNLVMNAARKRRPELGRALIRRSGDQFALYLAGASFWSGAYWQAIGWGMRAARSSLAFQVLPYAIRLVTKRLLATPRPGQPVVRPGAPFSSWEMPPPLIPYDRIYQRTYERLHRE